MKALPSLAPWLAPLGWLALEAAVVVLAALAMQPLLRAPATRRSIWRAVLVALALLLAAEFTGATSQLPAQLRTAWQTALAKPTPPELPAPSPEPTASFPIPYSPSPIPSFEFVPEPLPPAHLPAFPPAPQPALPPAPTPAWPAFLWLTGLAALLARSAWTHAGFAWLRLRHFLPAAEALRERVQALAARLGLRRAVRVLASERLRAPAAFGWVRPGVAVPGDFTGRFAPAQQDVMLAHELAHLAARDPLWQLLADLVTAALWWHPLAWVARRQHRIAGELAADDASLALPNGPVVLAECLLVLGHEAADCPRAALGMAGFHSQLGRRIERLLALPRRDWQAPSRARLALQTAVALLALAAIALLPGCAANRTASEAPSGIVAKWWQAKKAPVGDDVRSLQSNAERGTRNAESSQSLVTSSPTNALDISVGRQLFVDVVDDLLIASNTLKRTWHQPVIAAETPFIVLSSPTALPEPMPFCESVWYDTTSQLFRMRFVFSNEAVEFHSTNGINWPSTSVRTNAQLAPRKESVLATTGYESLDVRLVPVNEWPHLALIFRRAGTPPIYRTGHQSIHLPRTAEGSRWTDLHPMTNGFLVVGRNLHFYFSGRLRLPGETHASTAVGLATLRRDGFASLDAGPEGGVMTTKPVTFTGKFMFVNMKTNAPDGEMRIEILDADGNALERFSRAKCIPLAADQTLMGVSWQNGAQDLSALIGKPVRFRFHLKNASLYSFWVGPGQLGRSMGRVAGGGPHFTNDVDTIGNASYRTFPIVRTNAATRHQPTVEKLARIRIPELTYDGLPLPEVLKMLEQDTKRNDPDKQGVSFGMRGTNTVMEFIGYDSVPREFPVIIQAQSAGSGTVGVSFSTDVPLPRSRVRQLALDMDTVLIKVTTVLRDVSVLDALDTIVKTSEAAIGYTVETNRVVIHPRLPGREFVSPRISTNAPGAALRAKAEKLVLPVVQFNGLPLPEVIKLLINDTRKFDPDKQGLNFLATSGFPDLPAAARPAQPPALDTKGNPIAAVAAHRPDLDTVIIRLGNLRTNQTLLQVLDAICAAANQPITYRLEDYAVLITPKYPGTNTPADHATQILGVMPIRLLTALARELGRDAGQLSTNDTVLNGLLTEYLTPRGFATPPGKEPVFRFVNGRVHYTGLRSQSEDFARLLYKLERSVPAPPRPVPAKQPEPAKSPKPGAFLPLPTPVAADVRRLTPPQTPDAKPQIPPASQRLVNSSPTPLQAAEAEALRRQERKVALDKLLGEAGQFQKVKSWTNAVVRYEEAVGHAKVLGGVETVEKQYRNALAGLIQCRLQLALELQEKYQFKAAAAEVDKILPFYPGNFDAEQFKRFNERVEAAHKGRTPIQPLSITERSAVMQLVRDGKLHWDRGDYREAKAKLEEAVKKDPLNEAAFYYLRLVMESEFDLESKKREKTYGDRVVEVTKKWNEAARTQNGLPVPNPYFRTNSQVPFLTHSSKGAQRINRKLEEIVLPEVHFDGVTLAEVLKRLDADAKKFDPEKLGLNFLINDVSPPAPLLDANGNPVPVAQPVALSEGLIRVGQPLKNLTLRHALEVICENAELPTQFSVKEYAIAFIPRGPGNAAYFSRTFRVNPDTFMQGLRGVVANPVLGVGVGLASPAASVGTTTGPVRATVPATVPATPPTTAEANALVRQFFQSVGVTSLGATNSSTQVIFNPENGLLLVRGTTNDLRVIEQAIQKVQPPLLTPTNAAPRTALPNPYYRTNNSIPFLTHSSKGAQRINAKLDEIILPEVHLDGVSLPAVVTWLDGQAKKFDPEKKGLNFMINNVAVDYISLNDAKVGKPAAPVLDLKGNPITPPAAKPAKPDLDNALIKVTKPLNDLTLRQVLDVICKTATVKMPDGRNAGLKFTIEEYAIVFSPKLPERASLFARTFKVDPETFIRGLAGVTSDEKLSQLGGRAEIDRLLRIKTWTNAPAKTTTGQFSVAGVPVTNQTKAGASGVVSTNLTAELNNLVRDYFRAAGVTDLGVTNGPDVTQIFLNDRNGLLLVRASLEDLDIIQMAIELLNNKPPQVLIEAKFVAMDQNDNRAVGFDWFMGNTRFGDFSGQPGTAPSLQGRPSAPNPTGVFPLPASPITVPAATGSETNKLVRTNAPRGGTITGILTAPQFAVIIRALEQRDAASVRSLPKVTTPSGKQAVIELRAAAKAEGGVAQGLKLEVLPSVDANGYTIGCSLIVTRDGKQVLESKFIVWDAQTVMLGGLELPGAAVKPGAKPPRLVLFLTPTIVDAAGNRIHATTDEMPFAPAAPEKK